MNTHMQPTQTVFGMELNKKRRLLRHLVLAAASILISLSVYMATESGNDMFRWSMGTAYASLVLLTITLSIGPIQKLAGRRNPISTYLRRDVGIWTGILGIVHTIIGLQVHFVGRMWLYFVYPADQEHMIPVRTDAFGTANYSGFAAALLLIMLLALSNNALVRKLGARRWKKFQRWNYAVLLMTFLHAVLYQILEERKPEYTYVLLALFALALVMQVTGVVFHRRALRLAAGGQPGRG